MRRHASYGGALDASLVTVGHAEPDIAGARLIAARGFKEIGHQFFSCEMPDSALVDGSYAPFSPKDLPDLSVDF